jgi:hypothetical protein
MIPLPKGLQRLDWRRVRFLIFEPFVTPRVEPAVTEYEVHDDDVADIPQLDDDDEADPKVLIEDGINNKDDEPVCKVRCLPCGCHDNDSAEHIILLGASQLNLWECR